jgi:peroxiredoxin
MDAALARETNPARWASSARVSIWDFARQLQARPLTDVQEKRVLASLADLQRAHPDAATSVAGARRMVLTLGVGKKAPEIVGADLEGVTFRLSDYRGRVVALVFSGDWCGICRSDYPSTRDLLGRFRDAPVTVLGVDSSRSLAAAKRTKAAERLDYRSWWDGGAGQHTEGPIASAWNVVGWPTVYVIDAAGVIRFVDVRRDHLIDAVSQLLADSHDRR